MRRLISTAVLLPLLAAPSPGQATPKTDRKPSLDDQLVRQVMERTGISPPVVGAGLPIGSANGSRALLLWKAGKDLELHKLERAETPRKGATPEPPPAEEETAEEEIEEEEIEEPAAKKPGALPKKAVAKRTRPAAHLGARLTRTDGVLTVRVGKASVALHGKPGDRGALIELLRAQRTATGAQQCVVEPGRGVRVQDVVATCDAVWAADFRGIALGGGGSGALPAASVELVAGLPETMGWTKRPPGICDGEVLLLVDAQLPWGRVARLYEQFALAGIWQLSFVGEGPNRSRVVVPLPIPADG